MEVFALRVAVHEVAAREKGLGASIVAGLEMHLRQPEGIVVVLWARSVVQQINCGLLGRLLVSASSLSATKMAVSY